MTRQDTMTTEPAAEALTETSTEGLLTAYAALTHRIHECRGNVAGGICSGPCTAARAQRDLIHDEVLRRTTPAAAPPATDALSALADLTDLALRSDSGAYDLQAVVEQALRTTPAPDAGDLIALLEVAAVQMDCVDPDEAAAYGLTPERAVELHASAQRMLTAFRAAQ